MKRLHLLLCSAVLLLCTEAFADKYPASTGIIPIPNSVEWGRGTFHMPAQPTYTTDMSQQQSADLAAWIETSELKFTPITAGKAIVQITTDKSIAAESYRLKIERNGVKIVAGDPAGAFYAIQSLTQMCEHFASELPVVTINDAPRFPYRGSMLDVSRHFRDKAFVKRHLDLLARYKINRFHWHLTDGAGWRIEIKKYPELTDIAAWRPYTNWDGWDTQGKRYCRRNDPAAYGGYYTQDDIREVVEYARKRHITVIPEIEMPGHSEEVMAVYPHLACTGKPYTCSDLCIGNEQTFEFIENVLTEVIELFPSEYIHIGGDEAVKRDWRKCAKCKARMQAEGLKDVDELQSYMIHRIEKVLNAKGRNLLGWDEILEGGLTPNATVMSWRGTKGGIEAARAGNHVVMAPNNYCYLDYCQDDPTQAPPVAPAFVALATAYSYDPAPDSLGAKVVPMILGVQGNLWCELIETEERAETMLWPRLLALAEVGWSQPANKSYEDFYPRALDAIAWMQQRGYHPFDQKNAKGPRTESLSSIKSKATGKPVTYSPIYSPKYAAAGEGSLTDGVRGDWNYGDQRWQGWLNTDVELTVDMGEVQPIKRIAADFMQAYYAWIWMPAEVIFSVSDDGKTFRKLTSVKTELSPEFRCNRYEQYGWSGETTARYVRLNAMSNKRADGWIFTDEIVIE